MVTRRWSGELSRHDARLPGIADLRARARRRLPRFVWDYLDSATGTEATARRNRAALDRVLLWPSILHGEVAPELGVSLFGTDWKMPFGVAPVGMSGMIWPEAEVILARAAAHLGLPYSLSTAAAALPEDVGPHTGGEGWFQLYPPRDEEIRKDTLARVRAAGFRVLVLTVDVPAASRRERQVRGGLTQPVRLSPRILGQMALRPAWSLRMARRGIPRMAFVESYTGRSGVLPSNAHAGYLLRTAPDRGYLKWLRDHWDGPLVVKGVLRADDAAELADMGVDGLWVSNHAGRQFDGAPGTADVLPAIRAATTLPIIADGGADGGLDILRFLALGADMVMLGRAWHYALAALGAEGPDHLHHILKADILSNMAQIGAERLSDLPARLIAPGQFTGPEA